jgi:hypothetical protein
MRMLSSRGEHSLWEYCVGDESLWPSEYYLAAEDSLKESYSNKHLRDTSIAVRELILLLERYGCLDHI